MELAIDAFNVHDHQQLGPFEIKDELIRLVHAPVRTSAHTSLNAARGNPNRVATRAREIFFLLGQFAISESNSVMADPAGLGGMPRASGVADRLHAWLGRQGIPADWIGPLLRSAIETFSLQRDGFVQELVDAIIGDNYPVPDRMLAHAAQVLHEYLIQAMCGLPRPPGQFDLFAVEGRTARPRLVGSRFLREPGRQCLR